MATLTTLVSFNGANGEDPYSGLISDAAGDLFGTTESGGSSSDGTVFGTVFEIAKTASGYSSEPTTLVSFIDGLDGIFPYAGVVSDSAGDLFGTTYGGGTYGPGEAGTVFEIAKTTSGYSSTPTTLVTFTGSNGANPVGGLIMDALNNMTKAQLTGMAANFAFHGLPAAGYGLVRHISSWR
jgi:hypothetical protein